MVIAAELLSPKHAKSKSAGGIKNSIVTLEGVDEQLYLEISENIISACSYSNLDTEDGREDCRSRCADRMCCFVDENDEESSSESFIESHEYGCADDPDKMCAAYAGCESLVISEDDAVIYDANGVSVFGEDDDTAEEQSSTRSSQSANKGMSSGGESSTASKISTASSPPSSELQLIQSVVSTVCSPENLHTRHSLLECASLCDASMCCFDRVEAEALNPKMDLVLRMEGVGNDVLDRSAMGTCMEGEQEGGDGADNGMAKGHFCQVHAGCKNILLLGAPSDGGGDMTRKSSSSSGEQDLIFTSVGAYGKDDHRIDGSSNSVTNDQERMLATVCILFGLIIGLTVYMLVFKRERVAIVGMSLRDNVRRIGPSDGHSTDGHSTNNDEEMVELELA